MCTCIAHAHVQVKVEIPVCLDGLSKKVCAILTKTATEKGNQTIVFVRFP